MTQQHRIVSVTHVLRLSSRVRLTKPELKLIIEPRTQNYVSLYISSDKGAFKQHLNSGGAIYGQISHKETMGNKIK